MSHSETLGIRLKNALSLLAKAYELPQVYLAVPPIIPPSLVDAILEAIRPEQSNRRALMDKVDDAGKHLEEASAIMSTLQRELEASKGNLAELTKEVEARKQELEDYAQAATISNEALEGQRTLIRAALEAELNKGKTQRQLIAVFIWLLTLAAGGWMGANYGMIESFWRAKVGR